MDVKELGEYVLRGLDTMRSLIEVLLKETIFKADPDVAREFSSAITLLTSLTALYAVLILVSAFRRVIGIILAIGWVMLLVAMLILAFR
ncbi:MAG: hypothetical protein DRJ40_05455 [Thermoprotei archaeon]|nr:MAG: hypothetical protein DRJ40_04070 [Thermoprotei archaeon]RLE56841.1 MAG: hypothetical protein DRJ40_05455 [Thermoprotei archaeon]